MKQTETKRISNVNFIIRIKEINWLSQVTKLNQTANSVN